MKLDIFTNQWLDIVFEGRNKAYGAYELRKSNNKTAVKALVIGAIVFAIAVSLYIIKVYRKALTYLSIKEFVYKKHQTHYNS